ncbi:MAG: ATP phosphoribosyltransferase regulatory subunit [Flavobacteriaceae bacterium]
MVLDDRTRDFAAPLADLFAGAGLVRAEPAILQSAELFLDLSGEDIRRRLLLVQSPDGSDRCLRPDYTIPVACDFLAGGARAGGYWYLGPVFRYRSGLGAVEIPQAGVERYGEADRAEADAAILALALETLAALGVSAPAVRIGDPGLMTAAINAFGLPAPWVKRLRRGFARPGGIAAALDGEGGAPARGARGRLVKALAGADRGAAAAMVEELVGIAGITAVGGRSAAEIADRLLEQAVLAGDSSMNDTTRAMLKRFAAVSGSPAQALDDFAALTREAGIAIDEALEAFAARSRALERVGATLDFAASFGRRLDYYSGFVFEVHGEGSDAEAPLAGGGRYDGMLAALGAEGGIPAVGFTLWLDRVMGAAGR